MSSVAACAAFTLPIPPMHRTTGRPPSMPCRKAFEPNVSVLLPDIRARRASASGWVEQSRAIMGRIQAVQGTDAQRNEGMQGYGPQEHFPAPSGRPGARFFSNSTILFIALLF